MEINFLGDSITEGCAASCEETNYVSLVGKILDAKVNNYGIGGTRIARQTNPSQEVIYDRDFNSRVKTMSATADMVVVFGGTNDFGHGDAPFGKLSDTTEDTFCGACYALFAKIKERFADKPVLVVLPLHRFEERVENICRKISGPTLCLEEYREALRRQAESFGFFVLDFWEDASLNPNTKEGVNNFWDGLHPNDAGHAILGKCVAMKIKNIIRME